MKIVQINKYYYQKGGSETVFFNTMELLKNNGHTVIPFSLKNEKNKPSEYASYFVDYPELSESGIITKLGNLKKFIYNKNAAEQLEKLLVKEKPDIAHIHLFLNSLSVSILPVLKKHKIPVVMTLHDYRLVCPAYTFTDGNGNICESCLKNSSYWHCITKRCSNGSLANSTLLALDNYFQKYFLSPLDYIDQFIFVSQFSRKKHIEGNPRFKTKSTVLYNFTHAERSIANQDKENYILYFGRISDEKGIPTLLQTVKDMPEVKLKVVGAGPLLEQFKNLNYSNVEFLGFKSGNELYDYVRKARFVVFPSECYENNPLSIVESLTLGTPVIGSNIGGVPELIKDSENGFLFEPKSVSSLKDAILKALNLDKDAYLKLCNNIYTDSEKFLPQKHYDDLISIYTQTINHENNDDRIDRQKRQ
ncbi:MAG: glycosyltransferase family 4 protein [Dysgonomonas sp.]